MHNYALKNIQEAREDALGKGTYILILHAASIPPHLCLLIDSQVYSLGVKGPKLAMPLELQLKLIRTKAIESIFVKLNIGMAVYGNHLYRQAEKHTLSFSRVEPGVATCLSPIRSFCGQVFGFNVEEIHFIYDLLEVLEKKGLIDSCSHMNMARRLFNGAFVLNRYTMQDIYESIYQSDPLIQAV
jgi:hypothetical protein